MNVLGAWTVLLAAGLGGCAAHPLAGRPPLYDGWAAPVAGRAASGHAPSLGGVSPGPAPHGGGGVISAHSAAFSPPKDSYEECPYGSVCVDEYLCPPYGRSADALNQPGVPGARDAQLGHGTAASSYSCGKQYGKVCCKKDFVQHHGGPSPCHGPFCPAPPLSFPHHYEPVQVGYRPPYPPYPAPGYGGYRPYAAGGYSVYDSHHSSYPGHSYDYSAGYQSYPLKYASSSYTSYPLYSSLPSYHAYSPYPPRIPYPSYHSYPSYPSYSAYPSYQSYAAYPPAHATPYPAFSSQKHGAIPYFSSASEASAGRPDDRPLRDGQGPPPSASQPPAEPQQQPHVGARTSRIFS